MKSKSSAVLKTCLFAISIPAISYAYLDPGTGSFVLQMAVAAILGAAFTIKTYWKKIVGFIKRITGGSGTDEIR